MATLRMLQGGGAIPPKVAPAAELVRATDSLLKAKRAMGGLVELVLSASDDRKLSITRGNLYNLLEPIESLLNEARDDVEAARRKLRAMAGAAGNGGCHESL